MFQHGDRIRLQTIGEDGLPLVRYGFVGGLHDDWVAVLFDGELKGDTVLDPSQIEPVTVTTVELRLAGADLLDDPSLRQGLVNLWFAEAEEAGLGIGSLQLIGTGVRDSTDGYLLAELTAGDHWYVLRASRCPDDPDMVRVSAERGDRA
jgi:hypothetical protein